MLVKMSEKTFNTLLGIVVNSNIQIPITDATMVAVAVQELEIAAANHNSWLQEVGFPNEEEYFIYQQNKNTSGEFSEEPDPESGDDDNSSDGIDNSVPSSDSKAD